MLNFYFAKSKPKQRIFQLIVDCLLKFGHGRMLASTEGADMELASLKYVFYTDSCNFRYD